MTAGGIARGRRTMSTYGIDDVMRMLPHRYPILMIDRILECDDETHIVGIKNVSANEPFFQGHFPGEPVMPGVLQLEAMAQTGGFLLMQRLGGAGMTAYFMTIDKAKFRNIVRPGDQMRIEVDITSIRSKAARFRARVLVDGAVASEAELMCMISGRKAGAQA
jgi:beta-hydroxyacyl-ACP dehydratase FabZ